MTIVEERTITTEPTRQDWLEQIHELGRDFETRAAGHDEDDSFVAENYAALKRHHFFGALVPEDFGGGGVSHSEMCELLRVLAHYCSSTALAHSMHQHLVATTLCKFNHGQGGEPLLRKVAAQQPVLVSTGANDWLESSGEAVQAEGGYRVTATKPFASQSAAGDILVTSAPYCEATNGWQVLHFPVPLKSDGVTVLNDWRALGMRGTGSHSVRLENVFVPESSVNLRRPRGAFHPVFNVVAAVAMPLVMSVYVGIAQKAARLALETAKAQRHPKPYLAGLIGSMMNELTSAELHWRDMIRITNDLDFKPENRVGQDILSRKTNAANACVGVVAKAMEIAGGQGFYRSFGLERLFRDVQAAKYHPLPTADQQHFLGEYLLSAT
ncbi:MAG TPA: acyl-CoA dehydrogenase family protein [Verrucomicrobiae bacterium]|nr:acyl-CoA dehydrogenase family protein [Verrucomicrobiae bacterium]